MAFISIVSGFLISLLGGLPPGNLNVTVVRLTLAGGIRKAYQFSTGVVVVEMLYMFFCMKGVSTAHRYAAAFIVLRWLMVFLLFVMAANCFVATRRKEQGEIKIASSGFALGLGLSAINVLQIPYWTGWITFAMENNWVGKDYTGYVFILAAGLGTFFCLTIFVLVGKKLSSWLARKKRALDLLLGTVFSIVALVQLYFIL
jgi:threonine/homoserine/homoserine lactone efflux protein